MKTKSTNKFVAAALALFMLLMSFSVSGLNFGRAFAASEDSAEEGVYVLNASDLPNVPNKGDMGTTELVTAGTNDYFKLHTDSNTRFDKSGKTFEDGFAGTQRINFNNGINTESFSNSIEFTTSYPATVKVWWVHAKEQRQIVIYNSNGTQAAISPATTDLAANATQITTFDLADAGKYYLGSTPKSNYIFKIEITEQVPKTYTLNASDLPNVPNKGDMGTTELVEAGTDNYFKIHTDSNTRFDKSGKTFDDGFAGTQRINFNSGIDTSSFSNSIEFSTGSAATVKVWWVHAKEQRQIVIYNSNGTQAAISPATTDLAANATQITTFELSEAGKFYLGSTPKSNYIFKVEVTAGASKVERAPWADVKAPVVTSAVLNAEKATVVDVTVSAIVGNDGGDGVTVYAYDKDGKEVAKKTSLAEKDTHTVSLTLDATGTYTIKAVLTRDGEEDKVSEGKEFDFTLPLGVPTLASATSKGNGTVEVIWNAVKEATGYEVYCGETKVGTTTDTKFMVTNLTVGTKYDFTVKAVRGEEISSASAALSATATKEAQQTWGFCFFGTSTNKDNNYVKGDLNADGKIQIVSNGGKGKFQESSNDGLAFYYTAIPTSQNFTLRAKVHVDTWTLSSGQEGFGLMAIDSLPDASSINTSAVFWSNMYRVGPQRLAYWYDYDKGIVYDKTGNKFQMNIGVGVQTKLGMTKDNIADVYKAASGIVNFGEYTLETLAVDKGLGAGTYSTVGNCTNSTTFKNPAVAELTDFIFELQRNNTGYFLSYYTPDGKLVGIQKFYEPKDLDQLDPDFVYVGFAAARNMEATVSDVTLTTIDPKDDKPAEPRPITKVDPKVTIGSSAIANTSKYELLIKANVAGKAEITFGGKVVATLDIPADKDKEFKSAVIEIASGTNKIDVVFTPDATQELPPYTELSSTDPVKTSVTVKYNTYFAEQNNLYVAPNGTKGGNGSKDYPLDIYTAVSVVKPGQTIVLMEGTYKLSSNLVIERGINGTADKMIKMVADPEAKTRPVLDLQKKAGIIAAGNYWYFKNFDITKSANGVPGLLVAGSNCTVDRIDAYTNGDCGIYIRAKGNTADPKSLWPKNNLILNCSAYDNADATGENADGFGAKFTVGEGNVFDGCVSYNNCDDGWDLYARGQSIASVTIKNCIAFNNGHNIDGSIKGNGNGFKLGGENMPAGHKIINSIAFNNDANGITCNSCPDLKIENCISFNNKAANVTLYTGNKSAVTDFAVNGVVSFKTEYTDAVDSLKPQTQTVDSLLGENNFYWADGNSKGEKITADMFKSLTYTGYERSEDGKLILKDGFLALSDKAPAALKALFTELDGNYSLDSTYVVINEVVLTPDGELPPPTGFEIAVVIAVIAISGAAALVLFKRKRRSK